VLVQLLEKALQSDCRGNSSDQQAGSSMTTKSILHALKNSRQTDITTFAANGNLQQNQESVTPLVKRIKTKRIVVDLPESDHITIKIFATQHGISIKQLVLIALQDAMQNDD
jgi:predicted DNA binding CopG/RHH family protein